MKFLGNIFPQSIINVDLFHLDFDTNKISEEILSSSVSRINQNPMNTSFEDTTLELTPGSETEKLINSIKSHFSSNYNLQAYWSHVHEPLESTNTHDHFSGAPGFSFSYYVKVPKDSGTFVVDLGGIRGPRISLNPIEGGLFLFPSWVPHLVTKNLSQEVRISISGNFIKK